MSDNHGLLGSIQKNVVLRTAVYYVALFGASFALLQLPQAKAVLEGSLTALLSGSGGFPGLGTPSSVVGVGSAPVTSTTLALTVAAAMLGAALLALPVAWIYAMTREKRGYKKSVVQTLMVLPPLVASVVVLVKYSLALAFGFGAIVAAVRFRNTLEDSKDAVYIFLATSIGLAAAVHLPVAAVISVLFNVLALVLWWTDFGKATSFEGERAKRRLEQAQAAMRQTGSFVAMIDNEIFENMTPQQLELVADRAWRRRRRLETDEVEDEEAQRRDVLLQVKTKDPEACRIVLESVFDEFLKKWRLGGVVHEQDGTHLVEYAVQLKKTARTGDLLDALNAKEQVMGAEIK
ncbi:MAG: DUF4956 domain-containing protein [Gemmatimonadaceae bacterium]